MGLFAAVSTVTSTRRASAPSEWPLADAFYARSPWELQLAAKGMHVSPHLALTLSAVYCGVTMIAQDIGTLPPHLFRRREDGGKERQRRRGLERLLRWRPNPWQTASEYWSMVVGHQLLRGWAISEIGYDVAGQMAALVPLNPDRCSAERLPNGRLRYKVQQVQAAPRYLTAEEVFVVRDFATDLLTPVSRIAYGMQSLSKIMLAEQFAGHAFKTGASASLVATVKGDPMDEEELGVLHGSITRYVSGVENAGGVLTLNDDVDIKQLSLEPEKLQMMAARQFGVSEVARWLKIPGHKLEAEVMTQAYAAREAANLEYAIGCLRPIVISLEQAIQRDLVLEDDQEDFFVEFLMDALFRGDMKARAEYYERAIRSRWMRPSEVRALENMNPDPRLDALSEGDFRPGTSARGDRADQRDASVRRRPQVRATLLAFEAAQRVVRKEVAAVTKLATKHASDVDAWKGALTTFYDDHAGFVAEVLRLPTAAARAYAAQHRQLLEQHGVPVMADWERLEAEGLASIALDLEDAA